MVWTEGSGPGAAYEVPSIRAGTWGLDVSEAFQVNEMQEEDRDLRNPAAPPMQGVDLARRSMIVALTGEALE